MILFFILSTWLATREFYQNINTLEVDFIEEIVLEGEKKQQEFKGTIYVKRPNLLKMVVASPDSQILLVDSLNVSIYYPSWNYVQVKKKPIFLADFFLIDMEKTCFLKAQRKEKNSEVYEWIPKDTLQIPFKRIETKVNSETHKLESIKLLSDEKNYFLFYFRDLKFNPPLKSNIFKLNLKKDVEIIKETD